MSSARATMRRFGKAEGEALWMASAISSSSACGSRSQAMAKALATERLIPAKEWTTIGDAASQLRPKSRISSTIAASGQIRPAIGAGISCMPTRRCLAGATPAGVGIISSGGNRLSRCEGARAAITRGSRRSGLTIRTMPLSGPLFGVEGLVGALKARRLGQHLVAIKIARLRDGSRHGLDGELVAGRRRAEQAQRLGVREAGDLGRLEEGAGAVGALDQRPDLGRNMGRQAEADVDRGLQLLLEGAVVEAERRLERRDHVAD